MPSRMTLCASTILRILADERYAGVYVIGKRAVLEVGGTRSRLKDRESWYIIPDHHPAIVEKAVFDTVQASQLRFSQPNKKKRDYPLKGKAFCGCCGHALSRTMQKTSYYHCRHSEADVESRCHKMRLNAAELEQTVFLTLKKQMEAAALLAPDGTLRTDTSVPERAEYEQQIEALQDGKRTLYERYLMGEIDLNTYKVEKAACDELLLKTKKPMPQYWHRRSRSRPNRYHYLFGQFVLRHSPLRAKFQNNIIRPLVPTIQETPPKEKQPAVSCRNSHSAGFAEIKRQAGYDSSPPSLLEPSQNDVTL